MPELWSPEDCSSFSETPLHGEGGPAGAQGVVVRSTYVIQIRNTRVCGGKRHRCAS